MRLKTIVTEWYQDYKLPSMFIATNECDWKCEKDCGQRVCQNSALAKTKTSEVDDDKIIKMYLDNPITTAIIFGGLEPFKQFEELHAFIKKLREEYHCSDTIVIYTGYNKTEILSQVETLKPYKNIVIKFSRYVPGQEKHYDDVLGVDLASDNQYAEVIS